MQTLVSTKYQVVIPKEARKQIDIKPGQKMDVEITNHRIILSKAQAKKEWRAEDYYKKLGGLWKGIDADKYLDEERNSWE